MTDGRSIRIRGQVQGVGFRPFVWKLASDMRLAGTVLNDAEGVLIHVAGDNLDRFEADLRTKAPALALVHQVLSLPYRFAAPPKGFTFAPSRSGAPQTGVVPDAATCADCLAEIRDPAQRRFGHAFANCTQCGPRFSILRALPYDRDQTTMAAFALCARCAADYADPCDRRFHAQPIACPDCGPRLWLEADGHEVNGPVVAMAAARLKAGEILAIKGVGGFHLACDARNEGAIARLRHRKHRPAKPFALMGTAAMMADHAQVSQAEAALLADPAAPIVLMTRKGRTLPDGIAPGLATQGWMLPATPLHHLLMDAFGGPLVMTSGNLSGAPPVTENEEARLDLSDIADAFLMHDREIARRLDDSVCRVTPQGPMVLRHARGLAPGTIALPPGFDDAPEVVAYGGQMKAAICLIKEGRALLSHHLGDLDDAATFDAFLRADADYAALFDHHPAVAACDLHPGYRATHHAATRGLPLVQVQHHHAHLASCLADNLWPRDAGPVAGIVLDGMGLGTDGSVWGGEVLLGDYRSFARMAHLAPAPLIGGDAAARDPMRNLLARLDQAGLGDVMDRLFPDAPLALLRQVAGVAVHAPMSTSVGRLFDAFAAALDLMPGAQSYEGEAAMRVEALAAQFTGPADPYPLSPGPVIDPAPMFRAWVQDHAAGVSTGEMAARFQAGVAQAFAATARALVHSGAARAVALSGGCFQNTTLLAMTLQALQGVPVLIHRSIPVNDGGLALGQAVIAAAQGLPG